MSVGSNTFHMFKKQWIRFNFVLTNKGQVVAKLEVYALNIEQAFHLGLAKAMEEGFTELLGTCETHVEEMGVKQ